MVENLQAWLERQTGIVSAQPVEVTIGRSHFSNACLVTRSKPYQVYERAVKEGIVTLGSNRIDHYLYVVGRRSDAMKPNNRAYTWAPQSITPDPAVYHPYDEWYVSSYLDIVTEESRQYHPFGPIFMIGPWPVWKSGYYAGWKIDTGMPRPYKRIPLTVKGVV